MNYIELFDSEIQLSAFRKALVNYRCFLINVVLLEVYTINSKLACRIRMLECMDEILDGFKIQVVEPSF